MSLEDAIAKLTAAVEANTAAVHKVLVQAAETGTDVPAESTAESTAEEPKKRGRKPKEEVKDEESKETSKPAPKEEESSDIDFATVRKKAADWLGEFAKESDKTNPENMHPEAAARKEKIKAIIKKLGGEKLNDLQDDQDKVNRLNAWLDKTKVADNGFGPGRLVADPAPAADDEEDDDEV